MSIGVPNPVRPYSEERPWPRQKPVFAMLACLVAVMAGALVFAWQYKTRWRPLERYYFPAYVQTAHLTKSSNPYLRAPRNWEVLVVRYPHGLNLAVDSDVIAAVSPTGSGHQRPVLQLSPEAIANCARGLGWESMRFADASFHAWLTQWIYSGQSLWQLCRSAWYSGLLVLAVLLPFAIRKDRHEVRKRRQVLPLKGANIVSRSHYHRARRRLTGVGWLTLGRASAWERVSMDKAERKVVRIARRDECQHFLLVGDTGSGKSSLIRQLLHQIHDRNETAIVYDPAREYLPQFFDPDRNDIILNPLDARMPYWSPADEILHHAEAETVAKSLYPDREHEYRFFIESPRKIFAHLLKYRPTPEELCRWIAHADPEIDRRVARTPLEALISKSAPQQRSGVLSGLERVSNAFELLPRDSKHSKRWTATRWAEERKGWIFLTTTPETRERLRPLVSLWLDVLILRLTSQTDYGLRPVWVVLDELASLETLPTLPLALAESRKSNTRIVLGFQGRSQIEARYGREAEAMLSQPRTRIFLRTGEPRAAEWVSKCIGEAEMEHVREGRSTGDWGMRSSRNATLDRKVEAAILASEIANLEDLTGYFQTPGYTLKLKFPFFKPEAFQPSLVRCDPPELYPLAEIKEQRREAELNVSATEPEPSSPVEEAPEMKPVDNRKQLRGTNASGDTYSATGAA